MDAAERTKQLDRSLRPVGWWFFAMWILSQFPVVPIVFGGLLALELWACADASEGRIARQLRWAALLALPPAVMHTVAFFTDARWFAVSVPFASAALCIGVDAFAQMAEWFGGADRWRRARHEATAVVAALCLVTGLALATPGMASKNRIVFGDNRIMFGDGDPVAVQIAVVVALVVLLYGTWRISVAFRDLRIRVHAAVEASEPVATLSLHG